MPEITVEARNIFFKTVFTTMESDLQQAFYYAINKDRMASEELDKPVICSMIRCYRELSMRTPNNAWDGEVDSGLFTSKFETPFILASQQTYENLVK